MLKARSIRVATEWYKLSSMTNPFNQSAMLKPGMPAPDFTLPDQSDQPVQLSGLLQKGWVVLFFYPKDHSPICTTQVCAFRNAYHEFQEAGAEVLGISADSVASHQQFTQSQRLPFTLLSDPNGDVAARYGVLKTFGLIPGRVTFVIDPQGVIRMAYPSQFNAKAHMEKALSLLKHSKGSPTEPVG